MHLESLGGFPSEQQASVSEMHQDVSHDLPQVHAADHLLISQRVKGAHKVIIDVPHLWVYLSKVLKTTLLLPLFPRVGGQFIYKGIELCAEVI